MERQYSLQLLGGESKELGFTSGPTEQPHFTSISLRLNLVTSFDREITKGEKGGDLSFQHLTQFDSL